MTAVGATRTAGVRREADPVSFALLVLAATLHLPLVYALVAAPAPSPVAVLAIGLLAMGLGWSAGCSLEGRRPGTVRLLCALGVLEGALAFFPALVPGLGAWRWAFPLAGALSGAALVRALRAQV